MSKKSNKFNTTYIVLSLVAILLILLSCFIFRDNIFNKLNVETPPVAENDPVDKDDNLEIIDTNKNRFEGLTLINDNRGVPVLYYHSVDPTEGNEVTISPDRLRTQLQYIKDQGYTTLTMGELTEYILNNKEIPEKSIVITFDDGYMDNYIHAFPLLKELDMKASIFVIANGIDDGYYLASSQLKEMSDAGIDIISHTLTHPDLRNMTYNQQLEEFKSSKSILENITGKEVTALAYPFGYLNDTSKQAAKDAGYTLGFTTDRGYSDRNDDPMTLDRIYISSAYSMDTFKDVLHNTQK